MSPANPFQTVVVVRYGEIGLKGENRPAFERQLVRAIQGVLDDLGGVHVVAERGRVFVVAPPEVLDAVCSRIGRVFGVTSFSVALAAPKEWEAIIGAAREVMDAALRRAPGARTFKVDARRADKRFPLTSLEINEQLGALLLRDHPGLHVDVRHPEIRLEVEIRNRAYLSAERQSGPGGLPVGSSGRAHLLLSGGIDSPVAGWLMMKRGLVVEAVHFHSFPFTSERSLEKVVELCRILSRYARGLRLHVVPFTDAQKAIYAGVPERLVITVMRRVMFRIAEAIALARGGGALVTGESLGQVASQTLESIGVIGAVATLPVLRPLIGMDKAEIVELARRIGTYETSILPYEDCCTVFVPRHPATRPRAVEVDHVEARLPVAELVAAAATHAGVRSFLYGREVTRPGAPQHDRLRAGT